MANEPTKWVLVPADQYYEKSSDKKTEYPASREGQKIEDQANLYQPKADEKMRGDDESKTKSAEDPTSANHANKSGDETLLSNDPTDETIVERATEEESFFSANEDELPEESESRKEGSLPVNMEKQLDNALSKNRGTELFKLLTKLPETKIVGDSVEIGGRTYTGAALGKLLKEFTTRRRGGGEPNPGMTELGPILYGIADAKQYSGTYYRNKFSVGEEVRKSVRLTNPPSLSIIK